MSPAVITLPFDPVLFRLGPLAVHWYGIFYALAFFVGYRVITPFLGKRGISEKTVTDLVWWNIVVGLVCARLYYVIQQPDLGAFATHPVRIIAVWEGGMAFFGALLGCLATTTYLAWKHRFSIWLVLDAGALFATLPQAIGRLGNIVNGDILGAPSNLPWAVRYTNPHTFAPPPLGTSYQPANAYELLASLALFGMVVFLLRRKLPVGVAGITYILGYGISQFLVFFARATEPTVAFGLKQAQLTALVAIFVVVPLLVALRRAWPLAFGQGQVGMTSDRVDDQFGGLDRGPDEAAVPQA
ncbi:MAG: prolipoprotein diacylglyceryl transferase [Candidatus Dormibacteria bacterium]